MPPYSHNVLRLCYSLTGNTARASPTRLSLSMAALSRAFGSCVRVSACTTSPHHLHSRDSACPVPLSLAVTNDISFDFFSCGY